MTYLFTTPSISEINIQNEISIDETEMDVFNKESLRDITVTETRTEVWVVLISYNENSKQDVGKKLLDLGYQPRISTKNKYFSIGPYTNIKHAKNDSKRLKQSFGIENQIKNIKF